MSSNQVISHPRSFFAYIATVAYRGLRDFLAPIQKLPSEPIIINPNEIRVWMVGHATVLINFFGTTILTDPVLVWALPFPKRIVAHAYTAEELPPLDCIVISHAHLDHCDRRTLRRLASKTKTIILPRQCRDIVKRMPFKEIIELDWGESCSYATGTITAYRAQHWGRRMPWELKDRGFNCYIIERSGRTIFFGGDTGYGPLFKTIGEKHQVDLALLPISAYNPVSLRPHHMDPFEAHQAFADLKSTYCVPIHWGSFRLALEPMGEPPALFMQYAAERAVVEKVQLLYNGASFLVPSEANAVS